MKGNKSYKSNKGTVVITNKDVRDKIYDELIDFVMSKEDSAIDILSALCQITVDVAVIQRIHKPTFLSNISNHWESRSQFSSKFQDLLKKEQENKE